MLEQMAGGNQLFKATLLFNMNPGSRMMPGLSFLTALACVAGCAPSQLAEPRIEGKPLGVRLQELISSEETLRRQSAEVLRRAAAQVVPHLLQMCQAPEKSSQSTNAPSNNTGAATPDAAVLIKRRSQALNAFRAMGPAAADAVPKLAEMLRQPSNSSIASSCLAAIGGQGVEPLIDVLAGSDRKLAANAQAALDSLGPPTQNTVPILIAHVSHTNTVARSAVIRALGRIRQEPVRVVPVLVTKLEDSELDVQISAAYALGSFGPAAAAGLDKLLPLATKAKEQGLREMAGGAVWQIEPAAAKKAGLSESLIKAMTYTGPMTPP